MHHHFVISGRVQGVGYRVFIRNTAQQIGLTGLVRNLSTGQVEIRAEGSKTQLDELLAYAWRGPQFAEVTDIQLEQRAASGEFSQFDIR